MSRQAVGGSQRNSRSELLQRMRGAQRWQMLARTPGQTLQQHRNQEWSCWQATPPRRPPASKCWRCAPLNAAVDDAAAAMLCMCCQ